MSLCKSAKKQIALFTEHGLMIMYLAIDNWQNDLLSSSKSSVRVSISSLTGDNYPESERESISLLTVSWNTDT